MVKHINKTAYMSSKFFRTLKIQILRPSLLKRIKFRQKYERELFAADPSYRNKFGCTWKDWATREQTIQECLNELECE